MTTINWRREETAPTDGELVLVYTDVGIVSAWYDDDASEWVCFDDMFTLNEIEGWAPMPEGWVE